MNKLFIPVLLGTGRVDNNSSNVAKFLVGELEKVGIVETKLIEVGEMGFSVTVPPWGLGGTDEKPTEWQKTMDRADGLLLVTPEYNHGYPGELKLALDSLYKEYEKKPVAICGVASGGFGGARAVENIKPVLGELKMVIAKNSLYFSKVKDLFDENGNITDQSLSERAPRMFDELVWLADALKTKRNENNS
ncbi:MAG: NAD(P)H-dependent oxidoreductase [Parcubacteria group bacterium]|nr:NAD(P)H-dependent oxidoreductase [Parcubacteria group bacterium]